MTDYRSDDDQFGDPEELRAGAIWLRRDGHSNGRWLFVNHPDAEGDVPVGIVGVYTKRLTPAESRRMAQALLEAAEEGEKIGRAAERARAEFRRMVEKCEREFGAHDLDAKDLSCTRCRTRPATSASGVSWSTPPTKAAANA